MNEGRIYESIDEMVRSNVLDGALEEGSAAARWFVKDRDVHGSDILRPKKPSLKARFEVRKAPGRQWAVDDVQKNDGASFRSLDEVAYWIEQVSGEKVDV